MTTHQDAVYAFGGLPAWSLGIPVGPSSQIFWVDPANGSAGGDGRTPQTAYASIATAYAQCTSGNNDTIIMIGGATADTLTAAITWSKNYTHLIGLSSPLPGVGQRCRVVGGATTDLTVLLTVSGQGCIFQNIQFFNGADANVDSGAVTVSGHRNAFTNCFFAGMGHATPGARAGSYSLTVSGVENFFERCYIGLDTILRAAANADLVVSGSKNTFKDCTVASFSNTAGHFAVTVSGAGTNTWWDCLFHNFSTNWTQALTDAFNVTAGATHYVILRGNCQFVGYTGVGNTVTHIYGSGPAPNGGMFLSTNPSG